MLLTEYNEAEKLALVRDNAWREGQTEGIFDTLISLVKKNVISTKDAAEQTGVSDSRR